MDHVITITNNSVTSSKDVVFDHTDVGPGFSSTIPILIINNSDSEAELEFTSVKVDPEEDNSLFPHVNLSLSMSEYQIMRSASGSRHVNMINTVFCLPSMASEELVSEMDLPTVMDNMAQGGSLKVNYTLKVTVGTCSIEAPSTGTPIEHNLPPAGEAMTSFYIIGGIMIISFVASMIFAIMFLVGKYRENKPGRGKERL